VNWGLPSTLCQKLNSGDYNSDSTLLSNITQMEILRLSQFEIWSPSSSHILRCLWQNCIFFRLFVHRSAVNLLHFSKIKLLSAKCHNVVIFPPEILESANAKIAGQIRKI